VALELILPEWLYASAIAPSMVLTLDPGYFSLTGGIERWLYRLVRKHGGRQHAGWQFELTHLYRKSGSTSRYSDFASDLRRLVATQRLPGYRLVLRRTRSQAEALAFFPHRDEAMCRSGTVHKPVGR
jgi:plasmid replication initiation protein